MEEERTKKDYIILGVRILITVALILLGQLLFKEGDYPWYINLIVMGSAYLVIAYDIILEMLEGIFKEHEFFGEATLMVLASIGAFCLRFFGEGHNEYLEGVLVVLLFQIGEVLEDLAADRSKKAILSAIDLREEKANVLVGGEVVKKESEDLSIGDIVLCGNGEKILCDGEVIEGKGEVDESSLTGESRPIYKEKGAPVYAGTILCSGSIRIRVDKAYDDSSVGKLAKMIEEASDGKSRSERFISKFSKIYTPIVMAIALLVAVIPPLALGINNGDTWSSWIYTSLSFLVVSCPCAIVISVPLAYVAGLGLASKNGILVKGATYFDALNSLKAVAFDKTGTVTEGRLSIHEIHPVGISEERFMELLRIVESSSEHPLAKALFLDEGKKAYEFESYQEVPGKGIKAIQEGKAILAGKLSLLEEESIEVNETIPSEMTMIHLAYDGVYLGYVSFQDKVKETSYAFVNDLKSMGVKTILLSGDHQAAVDAMGRELGVDEAHGNLLPEQKLALLGSYKENLGGTIAYLGDGINDAPTLVSSDIGVAMGGLGSDLAVANADATILNDDPAKFVLLKRIAKMTKNRAIFNIVLSLSIKFLIVALGVVASIMGTWSLPLWVSVLGDTGVTVLAIVSSLLLGLKKVK